MVPRRGDAQSVENKDLGALTERLPTTALQGNLRADPSPRIALTSAPEVVVDAWPRGDLAPINDTARKVFSYWFRFQACPGFPASLHNARLGRSYLSGHLPRMAAPTRNAQAGSEILGFLPADQIDPDLPPPRYCMKVDYLIGNQEMRKGQLWARNRARSAINLGLVGAGSHSRSSTPVATAIDVH